MEIKRPWIEKLLAMSEEECLPLGDSPPNSIYSSVFNNKEQLAGRKFRCQQDAETKKWYVCRVK